MELTQMPYELINEIKSDIECQICFEKFIKLKNQ